MGMILWGRAGPRRSVRRIRAGVPVLVAELAGGHGHESIDRLEKLLARLFR